MEPLEAERRAHRHRERTRGLGVVRPVEQHERLTSQHLEPCWQRDPSQRALHEIVAERRLPEEGVRRGETRDGGGCVALAEHRQEHVGVAVAAEPEGQRLPGERERSPFQLEADGLLDDARVQLGCARAEHLGDAGLGLRREHERRTGLDDPRLLGGLGDRRIAEDGMIRADRETQSHARVGDIGRVPGATHADLEDRDVHAAIGEAEERERGHRLEPGDPTDPFVEEGQDRLELLPSGREIGLADRVEVVPDALADRGHVR
jgi:hypothetical protein